MMVAYNRILQTENKSVLQYLMHVKDYLECINHTSKLSSMNGSGLNHISLVQGLSDNYVRQRASKEAENWKTMVDAFDSITKIVRTAGKTKAYNEPRYETSTDIHAVSHHTNSQRGSFSRYQGTHRSTNSHNRNITSKAILSRPQGTFHLSSSSNKEPACYHCTGPHYITNCAKYQQDKDKYKHIKQQVKQSYQNRLKLGAKKNNVSISIRHISKMRKMTTLVITPRNRQRSCASCWTLTINDYT